MSEDAITVVERFKRQRAHFSCFGMGCGTTLLVMLLIGVVIWLIARAM